MTSRDATDAATVDYEKIARTPAFRALLRKKQRFILSCSLFFMVFYFTLPVLTAYTTILNQQALGSITWAWVFAFAQFLMTWALCILYTKRSETFDKLAHAIRTGSTGIKGDDQ